MSRDFSQIEIYALFSTLWSDGENNFTVLHAWHNTYLIFFLKPNQIICVCPTYVRLWIWTWEVERTQCTGQSVASLSIMHWVSIGLVSWCNVYHFGRCTSDIFHVFAILHLHFILHSLGSQAPIYVFAHWCPNLNEYHQSRDRHKFTLSFFFDRSSRFAVLGKISSQILK